MRRFFCVLAALVCLAATAFSASGATSVTNQSAHATVSADGKCQVSMNVTLHLESPVEKLSFPVPVEASSVALNGSYVLTSRSDDARLVDISRICKNVVGDVTFNLHYSYADVIHTGEADTLEMRLPLLAGFEHTVDYLEFTVTLPGQVVTLPGFVSGYHQARIEEHLAYEVSGAVITGKSIKQLKDHETLTMTLAVSEDMFPQTIAQSQDYHVVFMAMGICAAVAVAFWLLALWNLPVLRPRRATDAPQGYTAGHMGALAAGQGMDLTMMVFSWAQLGYVTISLQRQSKVVLYRRMDMGNERSDFEQRCFKKLFAGKNTVDTGSRHYAQLVQLCESRYDGLQELLRRRNGVSTKIFRVLVSGLGLLGGVGLAVALLGGAALQGLFIALLGIAGAVSGWHLQTLGADLLLGRWHKARGRLVLAGCWLALSLFGGAVDLGAMMVLGTVAGGVLLAWGGRRTGQGRLVLKQVCGLKRYLRSPDKKQLQRRYKEDPDYFFSLAPYAIALGVDRPFAAAFGGCRFNGCPYLTNGIDPNMTALQWAALLRKTRAIMDARAQRLPMERLIALVRSFRMG